MNIRQVISFSLATLLGLTSAGAYVPEHLGGEGLPAQASALQVEAAILLDEGGTPRCRIGEWPSEHLTPKQLGEFYGEGSQLGPAALDQLRECDENDELYAQIALNPEEIQIAGIPSPTKGMLVLFLGAGVINFAYYCFVDDPNTINSLAGMLLGGSIGWFAVDIASYFALNPAWLGIVPAVAGLIVGNVLPELPSVCPLRASRREAAVEEK